MAHVCAIYDGVEAVLHLAAYFAHCDPKIRRQDLTLPAALDFLKSQTDRRFDRIIVAPDTNMRSSPRLLTAILDEASLHSDEVVLLLPSEAVAPVAASGAITILRGPPFEPFDPKTGATRDEAPAASQRIRTAWLRKIFRLGQSPERNGDTSDRGTGITATNERRDLASPLRLLAIQPLSGGCGATTFAVNLALELADIQAKSKICLIDLNIQFGNVGAYLNLAANPRIFDAYRNISRLDSESFELCLQFPRPNLAVFGAPPEILPPDGITPRELTSLLKLAKDRSDLVITDLSHQLAEWSDTVFGAADGIFALGHLDVRTAQNMTKLRELLGPRNPALPRFFTISSRTPRKRSRHWLAEQSQLEKSCGAPIFALLPDGGDAATLASNLGRPLADFAPQNPLRKTIRDMAQSLLPHVARHGPHATEVP